MFIKDYIDKYVHNYPFHMPGHKNNYDFFQKDILSYDLTEFGELDNLQNPTGIIKNSLDRISKIFSSNRSFILVNGSTVGILTALLYIGNNEILVGRNAHKSFFSGIFLTEAKTHYIYPKINDFGVSTNISAEEIELKLADNPNIKAVFLTSPTYEGFHLNISEISKVCKKYNCILIVDEAHGGHFPFSDKFPKSAISSGCDISINSLHKTLPAFTQCGLLHISDNIDGEKISFLLNTLQTTSPSYVFMYAIDKLMEDIWCKKLDFENYTNKLLSFRLLFCNFEKVKLYDNKNIDISRFTFYSNCFSGKYMSDFLVKNGIQVEMYGINHIVLISTICDTENGLSLLFSTIEKLENQQCSKILNNATILPLPTLISTVSYKDIFNEEKTLVDYKETLGEVCGSFITPYPPGIPMVCPGEVIDKDVINNITYYLQNNIEVLGLKKNKILIRR